MANSTTLYKGNDGRMYVDVSENKTLAITDCGTVQNVITDAITVSLPATVVGYHYTIRNGGVKKTSSAAGTGDNGSALVTILPVNGADLIAGMELTASDSDSLNNTKVTAKVGDEMSLVGNGTTGWNIESVKGIWAQIAI